MNFKQMEHIDPCLFAHKKATCATHVDDCPWSSKDGAALDKLIAQMKELMDLAVEGNDASAFLGVQLTRRDDTIELTQLGLIEKVLETTGMQDCNGKATPATQTLGKDPNGKPFQEKCDWDAASPLWQFQTQHCFCCQPSCQVHS